MRTPGTRVMAVSHIDVKHMKAYVYGEGTYVGDEDCEVLGIFGENKYLKNPKIVLDSGKVVWGCQCWWGPIDVVKIRLRDFEICAADIDEDVKKYKKVRNGKS